MREECICPYCNKVVAPFDPERITINNSATVVHGHCYEEAKANARKDRRNDE